jgi:hypothetical protein
MRAVLTHEQFPSQEKVEAHRRGWSELIDLLAERLAKGTPA